MSTTLLEVTRASHEEIERLQRLVVKHLQQKEQYPSSFLSHSHQIRDLIDSITSATHKLIEIYHDGDNSMKDEILFLGGGQGAEKLFNCFYDRIREIVEYHRHHTSTTAGSETTDNVVKVLFSGEEADGRCLDLHELHNEYINLSPSKAENPFIDYLEYLDIFSNPDQVPRRLKTTKTYKKYLENLLKYLMHFLARTDPLKDLSVLFSNIEEETKGRSLIALEYFTTVGELIELGSEKLKDALSPLGLKTGGTVKQQAERLFAAKNTPLEQLHIKYFSKQINVRTMEIKVKRICVLLSTTIMHTKEHVERKQILTYNEIEDELLQHEEEGGDHSNDTEEEEESHSGSHFLKFHNGQPVEIWKYKLHGLKQSFNCEICGDHTYWGPREFQLHLNQKRHQYGMSCLSIPNSKSFYEITSINEAKALWENIKQQQLAKRWRAEFEEFEDDEGNIYNAKMYNDLKRQRLV